MRRGEKGMGRGQVLQSGESDGWSGGEQGLICSGERSYEQVPCLPKCIHQTCSIYFPRLSSFSAFDDVFSFPFNFVLLMLDKKGWLAGLNGTKAYLVLLLHCVGPCRVVSCRVGLGTGIYSLLGKGETCSLLST